MPARRSVAVGVLLYASLLVAHVFTFMRLTTAGLQLVLYIVGSSVALHAALCTCYALVMIRLDHAAYGHVLDSLHWRRIVRAVAQCAVSEARQALRVHVRSIWVIVWLIEVNLLSRSTPAERWEFGWPAPALTLVNAALQTIVVADLAISFGASHRASRWLFSAETAVDLVASPLATLAIAHAVREPRYDLVAARFGYLRMLSLLEPRAYIAALRGLDEVSVLLVKTVVQLVVMVLMFAGFFYEQEGPALEAGFESYSAFLYFMFITMSTVGYGDWSPTLPLTRWVCCFVILLVVTIVPATLNELNRLLASPARRVGAVPRATQPHFVLVGDVHPHMLDILLRDLYGRCRGASAGSASSTMPSTLVVTPLALEEYDGAAILTRYRQKVSLIKGDVLSTDLSLLQRLGLEAALGVFVIARLERDSSRQEEADERALLTSLALAKFLPSVASRMLVQLNGAVHRRMLTDEHVGIKHVVAHNVVKMRLLAKAAAGCIGLTTLLSALFMLNDDDTDDDPKAQRARAVGWSAKYQRTWRWELYTVKVPAQLVDELFLVAALALYTHAAGQLVALGYVGAKDVVGLNPGVRACTMADELVVLADSAEAVAQIMARPIEAGSITAARKRLGLDAAAESTCGIARIADVQRLEPGRNLGAARKPTALRAAVAAAASTSARVRLIGCGGGDGGGGGCGGGGGGSATVTPAQSAATRTVAHPPPSAHAPGAAPVRASVEERIGAVPGSAPSPTRRWAAQLAERWSSERALFGPEVRAKPDGRQKRASAGTKGPVGAAAAASAAGAAGAVGAADAADAVGAVSMAGATADGANDEALRDESPLATHRRDRNFMSMECAAATSRGAALRAGEREAEVQSMDGIAEHGKLLLVCGWPANLRVLLDTFQTLSTDVVCILAPDEPDDDGSALASLSRYDAVFFVRGSPLSDEGLRRGGAHNARGVVLFGGEDLARSRARARQTGDVHAVLAVAKVREALRKARRKDAVEQRRPIACSVIVDFADLSSVRFVNDGRAWWPSVSSLACNLQSPMIASGSAYADELASTIVTASHFMPLLLKVLHKLVGDQLCGGVEQFPVPPSYGPVTYGELFTRMAAEGYILIGLYSSMDAANRPRASRRSPSVISLVAGSPSRFAARLKERQAERAYAIAPSFGGTDGASGSRTSGPNEADCAHGGAISRAASIAGVLSAVQATGAARASNERGAKGRETRLPPPAPLAELPPLSPSQKLHAVIGAVVETATELEALTQSYVLINPPPDHSISTGDKMFVLSRDVHAISKMQSAAGKFAHQLRRHVEERGLHSSDASASAERSRSASALGACTAPPTPDSPDRRSAARGEALSASPPAPSACERGVQWRQKSSLVKDVRHAP